ncbi:S8 family peptidase [Flavobacterium sp. j3]|uniref:S8 family peptidase n=1 Tax=Flavobacterium aureirubrum TaxID=3133147 RepID=A0ABU9N9W5_9FLAO
MKKSHLFFKNPVEGLVGYKQKTRYSGNDNKDVDDSIIDYSPKKEDFKRSLKNFQIDRIERKRSKTLDIPENIEMMKITFHDVFDSSVFEVRYRNDFGLELVMYEEWNTVGVFVIWDIRLFNYFINQLEIFINTDSRGHHKSNYNNNIKFIKEFSFLTSDRIVNLKQIKKLVKLNLINTLTLDNLSQSIKKHLFQYLDELDIKYKYNADMDLIELAEVSQELISEIVDNFDIIHSVNSYNSGFVSPNNFNLSNKSFGFEISNWEDDMPIIGIIDTGIEKKSPLEKIIINDDSYNLTDFSSLIDNCDHGTSVALIAALGDKLYPNHIGAFKADAKLLSIKTLDRNTGFIFEKDVIQLIRRAHEEYNVRIFTLTIGYNEYKKYNEKVSEYAYGLDLLSFELNILIFISIGNFNEYFNFHTNQIIDYKSHFEIESSNLTSPSESMNNICVGAYASNLDNNELVRNAPIGTIHSIISRTFHYNWDLKIFKNKKDGENTNRVNKHLFKPDLINYGGDIDTETDFSKTGLKVLTIKTGHFFQKEIGTSYSAPFTANLAARVLNVYPQLSDNMQTVKALIINSSSIEENKDILNEIKKQNVIGNGFPIEEKALNSTDNNVTLIIEDNILPEKIKSYSLKLPSYLMKLLNKKSIIKIKTTLCFKFNPIYHNQFTYCPIHLAFGYFNDKELEIINDSEVKDVKLKDSWSQDYYFKRKVLSNVQKTEFNLTKPFLKKNINEKGEIVVKIAINSKLHKLLNDIDKVKLKDKAINFSLVISVEELPYKNTYSGKLYDEMKLINNLEAINNIDTDLEAEN